MKASRLAIFAAALSFPGLWTTSFAEKGFFIKDLSIPVTGFDSFVMERYDGNTNDSVWEVDTYKHTGPFTFSQGADGLGIETKGYWEWDYCVIVLPATVLVHPEDSLTMEMRIAPGSGHDSAMIGLQMGRSEKQTEDGVLFPGPLPVLVKTDWTKVGIAQKYGDDLVTHLFINIDAGYTTGPGSGWWVEPNKPFVGTVEIRSISLDGSAPLTTMAKALPQAHAPIRIDKTSIRYVGGKTDHGISVYDMAGHLVGSSRDIFAFTGSLKRGMYAYRITEGKRDAFRGTFTLLE